MTQPEVKQGPSRIGLWVRLLALAVLGLGGIVALRFTPLSKLLDQDAILSALEGIRANPAAPLLYLLVLAVLAAIGAPITPLVWASGAAFGTWIGASVALGGSMLGALATFLVARKLGYASVESLLGPHLRRLERLIARKGFWTLVRLRFVPIPFAIANAGCALCGVRLRPFLVSSALALAPTMVVWCWLTSGLVNAVGGDRTAALRQAAMAFLVLLALTFAPPRWIAWKRRQRLRELRQRRADRGSTPETID